MSGSRTDSNAEVSFSKAQNQRRMTGFPMLTFPCDIAYSSWPRSAGARSWEYKTSLVTLPPRMWNTFAPLFSRALVGSASTACSLARGQLEDGDLPVAPGRERAIGGKRWEVPVGECPQPISLRLGVYRFGAERFPGEAHFRRGEGVLVPVGVLRKAALRCDEGHLVVVVEIEQHPAVGPAVPLVRGLQQTGGHRCVSAEPSARQSPHA